MSTLTLCVFFFVAMAIFYTFDPHTLFDFEENNLLSLPDVHFIQKCTGKIAIANFCKGTFYKRVMVDCNKMRVDVETETGESASGKPCVPFWLANVTPSALNTEMFDLIVRGHSLRDCECTCRVLMNRDRALTLGVHTDKHKNHQCALSLERKTITDEIVLRDLGAESLDVEFAENFTLRQFFTSSALFRNENGQWLLKNSLVNDEESLLDFVHRNPLGVYEDCPLIQCEKIAELIVNLVEAQKLIRFPLSTKRYKLFRGYNEILPVDEDIRTLWQLAAKSI